MKHFLVYTLLRFGLFVATYAVLSLLAALVFGRDTEVFFVTLLLAAVLSSLLSLRLLAGPRERFASRARGKLEEIRSREDVD